MTAAQSSIPGTLPSTFEIGSGYNIWGGLPLDSDVQWTATGTGTLSNADASALYKLGNSDPTISSLNSIDSVSSPTFAWDGESTQYSGTNNTPTLQSGITIDDTSIYRSAANTLQTGNFIIQSASAAVTGAIIQGASGQTADLLDIKDSSSNNLLRVGPSGNVVIATTSGTAFQIQTAGSASTLFLADTSGMGITISGTLSVSGNLTLTGGALVTSSSNMYGTSLPASPVNGQEFYFVVDSTNNVIWHLRYNSTAARWEFLGGDPLDAENTAAHWTNATCNYTGTPADLSNGAITVTAPANGTYYAKFGGVVYWGNVTSAALTGTYTLTKNGTTTGIGVASTFTDVGTPSSSSNELVEQKIGSVSKNDVLHDMVSASNTNVCFNNYFLQLWPVAIY